MRRGAAATHERYRNHRISSRAALDTMSAPSARAVRSTTSSKPAKHTRPIAPAARTCATARRATSGSRALQFHDDRDVRVAFEHLLQTRNAASPARHASPVRSRKWCPASRCSSASAVQADSRPVPLVVRSSVSSWCTIGTPSLDSRTSNSSPSAPDRRGRDRRRRWCSRDGASTRRGARTRAGRRARRPDGTAARRRGQPCGAWRSPTGGEPFRLGKIDLILSPHVPTDNAWRAQAGDRGRTRRTTPRAIRAAREPAGSPARRAARSSPACSATTTPSCRRWSTPSSRGTTSSCSACAARPRAACCAR